MLATLRDALLETVVMVGIAGVLAVLGGLPLALLLRVTGPKGLWPRPLLNGALGLVVNVARSTPLLILLVAVVPFTRWVVGTSIGTAAAIVPLALAATPFTARLYEGALEQVDAATIEAALSFGASRWQVVTRVLLPEALPALSSATTVMLVNLVGASAVAGAVGGGGLGDLGIRYGYQRFQPEVMVAVVVLLVSLVNALQWSGDRLARRLSRGARP